jgi:protein-S-isoprenylcysteine O-methyltransferase Ste14
MRAAMTVPPSLAARSPARAASLSLLVTLIEAALLALGLGGAGALLAHPRALALVGVWLVSGLMLAWRNPVRAQDVTERPPGQGPLMVVLLVLPLATPPLCAWAERAGLWLVPLPPAVRWAGVALAAGGLVWRIRAMMWLGARFAPTVALQRGHALETGGPYAHARHPGYAGAWLANLGVVVAFGSAAGLASVALFWLALRARIAGEETLLARSFGPAWSAYAARVPRGL